MEFRRSLELLFVNGEGRNQKILMSRRGPAKHGAGKAGLPGGHIEQRPMEQRPETLREVAERETSEELGDEFARALRGAFERGGVTIAACVDDLRQGKDIYYEHLALCVRLTDELMPDLNAVDHAEHVDLGWKTVAEAAEILAEGEMYPPHEEQLRAFLNGKPSYTVVA